MPDRDGSSGRPAPAKEARTGRFGLASAGFTRAIRRTPPKRRLCSCRRKHARSRRWLFMAEVCRDYHLPGGPAPHTYTQIHTNCRVGRGNPPMGRNVQRRLFVATLVETCDRQGWRIHPKFSNSRQSIGRFGHPPRRPAQSPRAPRVNIWRASRSLAEKWGQKDSNPIPHGCLIRTH